jgi:hypothetical protein
MSQQMLYAVNVYSIFQQMGGKTMAQGMHAYLLVNTRFGQCLVNDILYGTLSHWLSGGITFK